MTKRNLTILIVAVLLAGAATIAIATSVTGGSNDKAAHTMPGGQMMNGQPMGSSSATGSHTMSGGQSMSGDHMQNGN